MQKLWGAFSFARRLSGIHKQEAWIVSPYPLLSPVNITALGGSNGVLPQSFLSCTLGRLFEGLGWRVGEHLRALSGFSNRMAVMGPCLFNVDCHGRLHTSWQDTERLAELTRHWEVGVHFLVSAERWIAQLKATQRHILEEILWAWLGMTVLCAH